MDCVLASVNKLTPNSECKHDDGQKLLKELDFLSSLKSLILRTTSHLRLDLVLLVLFPVFSPICLMTSLSWILLRAAGEGKFVSELTLTELSLRSLRAELNPLLLLVLLPRPTCSGKCVERYFTCLYVISSACVLNIWLHQKLKKCKRITCRGLLGRFDLNFCSIDCLGASCWCAVWAA